MVSNGVRTPHPLPRYARNNGSGQRPDAGGTINLTPQKAVLHNVQGLRILAVAEIRGRLSYLNDLAKEYNASIIIHTGNFGFFDYDSINRIIPRTLKHISMFSPLLDASKLPHDSNDLKNSLAEDALSELPHFISGKLKFNVPVYCIYGASEDLSVIESFNSGHYSVNNLYLIDETKTYAIETPSGHIIRLMGLGGSLVLHRFFDNGDGKSTIAGTYGLMWTTALQIGQLIQTVKKSFDASEIRIFISHPCPSREGLLLALAMSLRADFTISSGLHFIYGSSFNSFTAEPTFENFKGKLVSSRQQFMDIWENVKVQVMSLLEKDTKQKVLLQSALDVFEKMPIDLNSNNNNENEYLLSAYRNMWNFNLCDAEYGSLVLNVVEGQVGVESRSKGFDFKYRKPRRRVVGGSSSATSTSSSKPLTVKGVSSGSTGTSTGSSNTPIPSNTATSKEQPKSIPSTPNGTTSTSTSTTTTSKPNSTNITTNSNSKTKPEESNDNTNNTTTTTATTATTAAPTTTASSSTAAPSSSTPTPTPDEANPPQPGIWIANGDLTSDEIKSFFTESDQSHITNIEIKGSYSQPDKKFALVHFSTTEQAKSAIETMDKEKSGRVSIIGERLNPPPRRGGHFSYRGSSSRGRGSSSSLRGNRPSRPLQQQQK